MCLTRQPDMSDSLEWLSRAEVAHHNEVAKLRRLHDVVKQTRQQVAGCMDPEAKNYNPDAAVDDGACEYIVTVRSQYLSLSNPCFVTSSSYSISPRTTTPMPLSTTAHANTLTLCVPTPFLPCLYLSLKAATGPRGQEL